MMAMAKPGTDVSDKKVRLNRIMEGVIAADVLIYFNTSSKTRPAKDYGPG